MSAMKLAKTHPNLLRTIGAIAFVNITMAFLLVVEDEQHLISFRKLPATGIVPPLWQWGAAFFVAATFLIYGVVRDRPAWTRRGLVLSAGIGGFWAFGFVISFLTGRILGISAPLLWLFYTYIVIVATKEPMINPLSAVLQQDIHRTLQTGLKNEGRKDGN